MNATVSPAKLGGTLNVVSSKSLSHRALIAAGLSEGECTLHNLLDSVDISATKDALRALGVSIDEDTVKGGRLQVETPIINAKESGSTLRFMIPIALTLGAPVTFTGEGRLAKRPLGPYAELFRDKAIYRPLSDDALPLLVKGPLKPGAFILPGNISSQFISGLLFALPLLDGDSRITLSTPPESEGYIDLTLETLAAFGINVNKNDRTYHIPGNQTYKSRNMSIEGDYSQAAFFIVAALFSGEIALKNLNPRSKQGDKTIIDIVRAMGGRITYCETTATHTVFPGMTDATTIDLTQIPDLGPILMILAAASRGKTLFKGVSRLRYKESDRLAAMVENLDRLGVKTTQKDDTLLIDGTDTFKGGQTLDGFQDHRIVMALTVAALKADRPIMITGAEAINKSYPGFFKDFAALGGTVVFETT